MEGETLDDMSLSSSSSLDPHHASQEYMDDFDNLGERETHKHTFSNATIRYNDANKEGYPRLLGGGAQNRASCAIVVLTLTVKCVVLSCLEVFFLPKMIKSRSEKFNLMLFFFFFTRNE